MTQLDRIRWVKEYKAHPKRKEYEQKKEKLNKVTANLEKIIYLPFVFPVLLVALSIYGFICGVYKKSDLVFIVFGLIAISAISYGIHYLLLIIIEKIKPLITKRDKYQSELQKLKDEYREKYDLYEYTEEMLLNSECAKWKDDSLVCGITEEVLPYQDRLWCLKEGNCKYCRKFVEAYVGSIKYWRYEIKR